MVNMNLSNTAVGDDRPTSLDYQTPIVNTDGVSSQKETRYYNTRWGERLGHYKNNAHLKNSIKIRGSWIFGKGYTCDTETGVILDHVTGWGKESFIQVLKNMDRTMCIGGDAYAHIITDKETGDFINLKTLNPGSMVHVVNDEGILIGYEQISRLGDTNKTIRKFKPEEIFHVSMDRIADEIHGDSLIDAMMPVLSAWGENFLDRALIIHRMAKPLIIFKLKTDNMTKIEQIKQKLQEAMRKSTDNMILIPDDENILRYEVLKIDVNPLLFEQANALRKDFYSTIGSPELLSDSSGSTESGGKIGHLNFTQLVDDRQSHWEQEIWNQLNIKIELTPPDNLVDNLKGDERKDANQGLEFQQGDVTAGVAR